MKFANAITIERPRRNVFGFLAHFENVPTWNYAIVETRPMSDDPVAVGKVYRQIRSIPYRAEETFEVTTLEPDRALEIEGKFGPLHGTLTYELEDRGSATLLTNTVQLEARGLAKIAAAMSGGRLQQAVAANLGSLKKILEGSPDATNEKGLD
jgi:carbon monoxide dehydrogenase subunit G